MTPLPHIPMTHPPQIRATHLRDGFIVDKVGIARQRDRSPLPRPCNGRRVIASRYPKASALGLISIPLKKGFSPWGMPSRAETT
jgi:hypothetical protein